MCFFLKLKIVSSVMKNKKNRGILYTFFYFRKNNRIARFQNKLSLHNKFN